MPSLASHHSTQSTKMLLIGDSSSGKTGALASLAGAGYNLRILDLDNGIDILRNLLLDPKSPYPKEAASRVTYRTITETMRQAAGKLIPAKATVWPTMVKMLDHWKEPDEADGTPGLDLGKVSTWGPQDILVIDSLTKCGEAALNFTQSMNGRLGQTDQSFDRMRDIGAAQAAVANLLSLVCDTSVQCNVIVIAHITYVDDTDAPKLADERAPRQGYPSAIGKALSPMIPRWFNSMLLAKTTGSGMGTKHTLFTKNQGVVGAKSAAPLSTKTSYPLESGLADYFKDVRGALPVAKPLAKVEPIPTSPPAKPAA